MSMVLQVIKGYNHQFCSCQCNDSYESLTQLSQKDELIPLPALLPWVTIRQYRVLERKTSDYPALPGADMLLESLEQETLVAVVTSSESESLEDLDPEDFG